mmetsp:Transcript_21201/g.32159  ORF Transcript_21201/g.32159 Transcript_21201/m.32159 type:complete len:85 (+) Transcript_21201:323-577(+)
MGDREKELLSLGIAAAANGTSDDQNDYGRSSNSSDQDDENDSVSTVSASPLSIHEDFPQLFFAVKKGRYTSNAVFIHGSKPAPI